MSRMVQIVISAILFCALVWTLTIAMYAYSHLRIIFLEKYWSFANDDEFHQKLKEIVYEVNPNVVVFTNRNLAYKLKYIYSNQLSYKEKGIFRSSVFHNGLKPRVKQEMEIY